MKRVNVPNKYGLIEIDFDGCILVAGAMNGYGEPLNIW